VEIFSEVEADGKQVDADVASLAGFEAMGFHVLHQFDEIRCDAATFTMQAPS
jgi:hypothetical protein